MSMVRTFLPQRLTPVKVQYTGICASDTSQLAGHWGPYTGPIVCGHEIIGEVVKAGPKATGVKVGDVVGVGAQCDCCGECEWCVAGESCSRLPATPACSPSHIQERTISAPTSCTRSAPASTSAA